MIIGDISLMTDAEVKTMLDQIYWVYADNPGFITQTVDCIKMYVNYVDASIHKARMPEPWHNAGKACYLL